jgi:cobalt-zinc-cadmium efflux system protein
MATQVTTKTPRSAAKTLRFGLILNTAFTVLEFIAGLLSGSLALVSDATHNLTDVLTLCISYIASKIAEKRVNNKKSFGYGRATILAAEFNALLMIGTATFIAVSAYNRLNMTVEIEGGWVILVAGIGVLVNSSIAFLLYKHKGDLNIRSAFIDMLFDAISSVAAMFVGIVIILTGETWVDSAITFVIAGLLTYNALKILYEAITILLEGAPKDVDLQKITDSVLADERISDIDDIHIWTIRSNYNAMSCHIVISDVYLPDAFDIIAGAKLRLNTECNINHSAIELEPENADVEVLHEKHE